VAGAVGISQAGIAYDALDHKPVHVVFMLIMGEAARENHLRTLNQIVTLVNSEALAMIRTAKNVQDVYDLLSRFHLYRQSL
jgi:mannitol/fructose-specific phosphotransferase system IIA component (Ntr-type)